MIIFELSMYRMSIFCRRTGCFTEAVQFFVLLLGSEIYICFSKIYIHYDAYISYVYSVERLLEISGNIKLPTVG